MTAPMVTAMNTAHANAPTADPNENVPGFTVPFVAYLPVEHLNGSGLVAAVVAGLVAGQGAQRWFTPEQRLSDEVNWRTVELVLESRMMPSAPNASTVGSPMPSWRSMTASTI
jgi:NhaP-type Na+/H+ or K+/H+ antiporter